MYNPEEERWEAHTDDLVNNFLTEARRLLQAYPDDKRDWATQAIAASMLYGACTIVLAEVGEDDPIAARQAVHGITKTFFSQLIGDDEDSEE